MLKRRLRNYDINDIKHPEDSEILDGLNKIPLFKGFLNNTIVPIREAYNEVESYGDGWNVMFADWSLRAIRLLGEDAFWSTEAQVKTMYQAVRNMTRISKLISTL